MVYTTRRRKRVSRRRRPTYRRRRMVPTRGIRTSRQPFPQAKVCRLSYGINDDLVGVPVQSVSYKVNSPYDPPVAASTDQPYYFDQLAALYDRVLVYKISYQIHFINSSAHSALPFVQFSTNTTVPSLTRQILEDRWCRHTICSAITGGSPNATIRGKANISSIFGIPPSKVFTDDVYQALVTADPNRPAYLHIGATTETDNANLKVWGRIVLYCKFFAPKTIGSS